MKNSEIILAVAFIGFILFTGGSLINFFIQTGFNF